MFEPSFLSLESQIIMRVLLIFLDGVGLGKVNPQTNPFIATNLPTLQKLANGHAWSNQTGIQETQNALFIPTSATLGVEGRPQSGTGQAVIVTGLNIPQMIGEHYGPKPNAKTRAIINQTNIFKSVIQAGKTATLLEAYPPAWHHVIRSGKRLPSSYQQAAQTAGLGFYGEADFRAGRALSGDWTGTGWRTELGYEDTPLLSAYDAGVKMVELARRFDFSFFPHWMTDVIGHRGNLEQASSLLKTFDQVMQGALDAWDDEEGVMIITSDHGNIEDLSHRHHTENDVPTIVIGKAYQQFSTIHDLSQITPLIRKFLGIKE